MIATTSPLFAPMVVFTVIMAVVLVVQFGTAALAWNYHRQLLHWAPGQDRNNPGQIRSHALREQERAVSKLRIALICAALLTAAWLIPWDFLARGNL